MPKILILDDDIFILDMYVLKFREAGFDVCAVRKGSEAIAKLTAVDYVPEVILLDVLMPEMSGFEVLKKIKEDKIAPQARVIFLSNLGQREEIKEGMDLGADDYIVKAHHTPSEVVDKVRKVMER